MISQRIFMWSVIVFSLVQLITCPPTLVDGTNTVNSGVKSSNTKAPTLTTNKLGNVQGSPAVSSPKKNTLANPPNKSIAAPSGKFGVESKQLQAASRKPSPTLETLSKPLKSETSTASPAAKPNGTSPVTSFTNPVGTPSKLSPSPTEALKKNPEVLVESRQHAKSETKITDASPMASATSKTLPVKSSVFARSLATPPVKSSVSARSSAQQPEIARSNTNLGTTRSNSMTRATPTQTKPDVKRGPPSKSYESDAAQTVGIDYQSDGSKLQKQNSMGISGIIKRPVDWLVLKPASKAWKFANYLKNIFTRKNGENP